MEGWVELVPARVWVYKMWGGNGCSQDGKVSVELSWDCLERWSKDLVDYAGPVVYRSSWNKKYVRISNNQPIFTFGGLVLCGMGINLNANHEFAEYITPRLALPSWSIEIVFKRPDVLLFSDLMFGMFFLHPKSSSQTSTEVKMHSQCVINADGSAEIRSVRMPREANWRSD